ncbi:MAG TPA: hypothetical protein VLM38_02490 [Blastocatellia bacterium]|nr:hypothetical protein [Blastocatellia bacterium]
MLCETSFDSGAQPSFTGGSASAITFDEIERNDKVLINTLNSRYEFAVSDPETRRGMLSGGAVGEEPREATLIESITSATDGASRDFWGLQTGARALFYLRSDRGVERVTTSGISSITIVKAGDRKPPIS